MKKMLAVLLILTVLVSLCAVSASADEPKTQEEIELMQQAVVETALAFWWKGASVDYDFATLTILPRNPIGVAKMHPCDPPEQAAPDNIFYAHCADWINTVYYNTFHHMVAGGIREAYVRQYNTFKKATDPDVVLKFGGGATGMTDRAEFERLARELLQPGDIWSASGYPDTGNGHTMLYIGDYLGDGKEYVLHCSGGASDVNTGDQVLRGGIRLETVDYFFNAENKWSINNTKDIQAITIMRPINILSVEDITPAARTRLEYRRLELGRESDVFGYTSVEKGQNVTVKTIVANHGTEAYTGLKLTDPAPVGGALIKGTASHGGVISANGVEWTVDVAPGEKLELTYQVRVMADLGGELRLPAGRIGNIPSRDLSYTVCGERIPTQLTDTIIETGTVEGIEPGQVISDLAFANEFYRKAFDVELGLPDTLQELLDSLFVANPVLYGAQETGGQMLHPRKEADMTEEEKALKDMIIPDHLGGRVVYLGGDNTNYYPVDRVTTYQAGSYMPGDVIVCMAGKPSLTVKDPSLVQVYIYLGQGKVATMGEQGLTIATFEETIELSLCKQIMLGFRPTLTRGNIMEGSSKAPVVPEEPAASGSSVNSSDSTVMWIGIAAAAVVLAVVIVLLVVKKKKA